MTDDPPGVEGTGTNGPDGGSFGGNAAWLEAAFRTRNWYGSMIAVALSPWFRADGGFLPQADLLEVILNAMAKSNQPWNPELHAVTA